MAELSGRGGHVTYGGVNVARVSAWNSDIDTNMLDVTAMSTSTGAQFREYVAGLTGGNFSIDCYWDISSTASNAQKSMIDNLLAATTAAVVLEFDKAGGGKLSGNSYLNRMSGSVDIDGTADISFDGTFTGTISLTTTT